MKKLFLFFILCFYNFSFGQFYFGTCGGYLGDNPIIGKFVGVFKIGDIVPITLSSSGSGRYGVNVFKITKTNVTPYGGIDKELVKYLWYDIGHSNPIDTNVGSFLEEGFYYTDKGTTFAITKNTNDTITNTIYDTIKITNYDTIKQNTIQTIRDTIVIKDTLVINNIKTIIDTVLKKDTIHIVDTFNIVDNDTINTCKLGTFNRYFERLVISKGKSIIKEPITIDFEKSISPSIEVETNEDVNVEVYVYDNLGVSVTQGIYKIKASTQKQYINFNGYSKHGSKVSNGVYLIRVISEHNNMISNNLYRVGISN